MSESKHTPGAIRAAKTNNPQPTPEAIRAAIDSHIYDKYGILKGQVGYEWSLISRKYVLDYFEPDEQHTLLMQASIIDREFAPVVEQRDRLAEAAAELIKIDAALAALEKGER